MVYRRDDSPGYRSRSRSPFRGRSRSISPSRSRSRSYSPRRPPAGYPGRGPPVFRGPLGRRRSPPYHTYSRSRSPVRRVSRSRSKSASPGRSSSEEPGQIRTAPKLGKQRGGVDAAQLQALKEQLEAEQVVRAAAEGRVEFLKGKVREVADRSKQRGNMLAQVCAAYRKVSDAKQQLQEAEHELQQALKSAEAYLQEDDAALAPSQPQVTDQPPAAPESLPQHAALNGHDPVVAAEQPPAEQQGSLQRQQDQQEQDAHGGWIEAAPASGAQGQSSVGPLGNIKFKLKL